MTAKKNAAIAASLLRWIPEVTTCDAMRRNGYARLTDLETPWYDEVMCAMEGFQAAFLAITRAVWQPEFPIPGDALSHFSRQWEYPYTWASLADVQQGQILDAGSGITFFPFLLAAAGHTVDCCDNAGDVDLPPEFQQAVVTTGCTVAFSSASLASLPYAGASFDAAVCVSVLEHVSGGHAEIVEELARVLRPRGRLVVTVDVSLRRDTTMLVEDVGVLIEQLSRWFRPCSPIDLRRPPGLLSSDAYLTASQWRLPPPWRPPHGTAQPRNGEFRSIAVLGLTLERRAVR